jgi:hypothetical protein
MEQVARLAAGQRRELFAEAAARRGMTPAVVEKDFWVTWMLDRLFADPQLAELLMFKGGTSLSKAYGLIERFSEDIDLILDWRVLSNDDPLGERSRTKQGKLNADIDQRALDFIAGPLLRQVSNATGDICYCAVDRDDGHVIGVHYPAAFPDTYLRPELRLEIGPLAAWLPHESRQITCYAAEVFPKLFSQPDCSIRVIQAKRTFWEKATILHHEAHRPADSLLPARYSRHYYDLARMAASSLKEVALADTELLADVVAFKQRFYPRNWARYDLAMPGSLRLVPSEPVLKALAADYRAMANMIFGQVPAFDDIVAQLRALEDDINGNSHERQ